MGELTPTLYAFVTAFFGDGNGGQLFADSSAVYPIYIKPPLLSGRLMEGNYQHSVAGTDLPRIVWRADNIRKDEYKVGYEIYHSATPPHETDYTVAARKIAISEFWLLAKNTNGKQFSMQGKKNLSQRGLLGEKKQNFIGLLLLAG